MTEVVIFSSCWNTACTDRKIESENPPDVFIDLFNTPDSRHSIIIRTLSRQHSEWQELIVLVRQPSGDGADITHSVMDGAFKGR